MCRWIAYSGAPLCLDEIVFKTQHSLIDQSLHARHSESTTNGDGFGLGWYGKREIPGIFRDIRPAWNDTNLKALAAQIDSHLFVAHIRAATGTAIQRSNCHPFQFQNWLLVHNGAITDFHKIKRDLLFAIDPEYFGQINGTTDSEIMFYLALTFGMQTDVVGGVARMVGLVEATGRAHGVDYPMQMTLCISDGTALYAFRYSSEGASRSLYVSASDTAIAEIAPDAKRLAPDARVIVSEPLSDLAAAWLPVPEASFLTVVAGDVVRESFAPIPP